MLYEVITYQDKMQPIIDELEEKGLLVEDQGAKVVMLDEYDMPPCMILKKDGASLYATRDMAAAQYRKDTYDFHKCLYVTVITSYSIHYTKLYELFYSVFPAVSLSQLLPYQPM